LFTTIVAWRARLYALIPLDAPPDMLLLWTSCGAAMTIDGHGVPLLGGARQDER